eukprot:3946163-Pleurochrysis_carterae.AAC.1
MRRFHGALLMSLLFREAAVMQADRTHARCRHTAAILRLLHCSRVALLVLSLPAFIALVGLR